ncbi:hypothetical protein GTQ40_13305 [Flavobacteriaceae bacterium R38]|nr:hypothetical protein [Flavobacteriaceae bacterium R38]
MKKRNLKNLNLEKKVISKLDLNTESLKGGIGTLRQDTCPGYGATSIYPYVCKVTCPD